jgi:pSer/pThr/pTyr-binding forkhead associated (FHA) protein
MGKLFFLMITAGISGIAGWAVSEPFAPSNPIHWARWEIFFSLVIGGFIGAAVGGISGYLQGSRTHLARGLLAGLALGAVGGYVGLQVGGMLAEAIFGRGVFESTSPIAQRVFARTLVFVPFGALVGMMNGVGSRSMPRAVQGMIGGAIGGGVGGFLFDSIGDLSSGAILALRGELSGEVGAIARAFACAAMGAGIGLFVGIVELLSKRAWVRLELGRNEGKEWTVDSAQTFIGRSETAHVPLFGDPNVLPLHACIVRESSAYKLLDGGSPIGIGVNGIRVPEALLNHGDVINIGSFSLRFLLRNPNPLPAKVDAKVSPAAQPLPQAPAVAGETVLTALDGPLSGNRFRLGPAELEAGRECQGINLSFDSSASRRHAAFSSSAAGVIVRDLGSTNGTYVNGVRVQEMTLRPGDAVRIGATTFRLDQ